MATPNKPKQATRTRPRALPARAPNRLGPILILILIVVLAGALLAYLNRPGSISGRVLDAATGESLRVSRIQLDDRAPQTSSELTGAFIFPELKPGPHKIRVEAEDFKGSTRSLTLRAGESLNLQIELEALPRESVLKGRLLLVLTGRPNTLVLKDESLADRLSLPLDGRPAGLVLQGQTAYVSLSDRQLIVKVDLAAGKQIGQIELPLHSHPADLALVPGQNQLLVMNKVTKNLSRIDLATGKIAGDPLPLPVSPDGMVLDGTGTIWVACGNQLIPVQGGGAVAGEAVSIPGLNLAGPMRYSSATGNLYLPSKHQVAIFNPLTRQIQTFPFDFELAAVGPVGSSQLLVGGLKGVLSFNPLSGGYDGSAYNLPDGELAGLQAWGADWMLGLKNPAALSLVSLNPAANKQTASLSGELLMMQTIQL